MEVLRHGGSASMEKRGLPEEDIGVFSYSVCRKVPKRQGTLEKSTSSVNGVISITIYAKCCLSPAAGG